MTRCVFVFTFQRLSCPQLRDKKLFATLLVNIIIIIMTCVYYYNKMKEAWIQVNFRMAKRLKEKLKNQDKEMKLLKYWVNIYSENE